MISKLRHRIQFQLPSSVSDGAGGTVNTLNTIYTCWAEIRRNTQDRDNILSSNGLDNNITFKIRYINDQFNTSKDLVILYADNLYFVNSWINEDDLNQYYLVSCSTIK